jgi:hypothetical protein
MGTVFSPVDRTDYTIFLHISINDLISQTQDNRCI